MRGSLRALSIRHTPGRIKLAPVFPSCLEGQQVHEWASVPGLGSLHPQARQRALQSLGLAAIQAEVDAIVEQKEELERRERQARRAMLATVRRVPVEAVEDYYHCAHVEISSAIQWRQTIHEDELLAGDPLGQQLLHLRQEKDNLLDTISR